MSIRYVCYDCKKILGLYGFNAINELGRKRCDRCGCNDDTLTVVGEEKYNQAMQRTAKDLSEKCSVVVFDKYGQVIGSH